MVEEIFSEGNFSCPSGDYRSGKKRSESVEHTV